MSYRSYIGGPTSGGYTNETFGYAQTFMMLDIAAAQIAATTRPVMIGGRPVAMKPMTRKMAEALESGDHPRYESWRRRHIVLGFAMVLIAIAGCIAGPILAWLHHAHPAMQAFLLSLPFYFLLSRPAKVTTAEVDEETAKDIAEEAKKAEGEEPKG